MGKIISISNQKGGVGKTTTAVNLASSLAIAEKRVLLVDLDAQGNATSGLGISKDCEKTSYDLLLNRSEVPEVTQSTKIKFLQVVPAGEKLIGAEVELAVADDREKRLKKKLEGSKGRYDYIFIDCPPSLGLLTLNSFVASGSVLIPVQCEYYALEGLSLLLKTVNAVRRTMNSSLEIEGLVLTMYDMRTRLSSQVEQEVREYFGRKVFRTLVPKNVRLSEAPSFGKPVILYDVASKGAQAYINLAKEVIKHG